MKVSIIYYQTQLRPAACNWPEKGHIMTDTTNARMVGLTRALVRERAKELAHRPFLSLVDRVEQAFITNVLTGECGEFDILDVWLKVLRMHNCAPVPYEDPKQEWQHEPYAAWRLEAQRVMQRLEDLAAGRPVAEDTYVQYPRSDEESTANKRHLDALLSHAADMLSYVYGSVHAYDGEDLLSRVEHDVRFHLQHHYSEQWFDDTYALGYSMMDNPGPGTSPFGSKKGQVAMMRSMAQAILDAVEIIDNEYATESVRTAYGHTVKLFWPMLKGAVLYAVEDMNSPVQILNENDEVISLIEQALRDGLRLSVDLRHDLELVTHNSSPDGVRTYGTPTADLIERFKTRVTKEQRARSTILL